MSHPTQFEPLENRQMMAVNPALPGPTVLVATPINATVIKLTWKDNARNESGYQIERSTDGKTFVTINSISANSTLYRTGNLVTGQKYWYRVRGFNAKGTSAPSNIAKGTPKPPAVSQLPLGAPVAVKATPLSSSALKLTWLDNAKSETGYAIERSTDGKNRLSGQGRKHRRLQLQSRMQLPVPGHSQ